MKTQLKCRLRIDASPLPITCGHNMDSTSSGSATVVGSPAASPDLAESKLPGFSSKPAIHESQRFFIGKSLTIEDIKTSIKSKLWTTQPHVGKILLSALKVSTGDV
jgi:hypothetical protein